jgi:hypothetical protein
MTFVDYFDEAQARNTICWEMDNKCTVVVS